MLEVLAARAQVTLFSLEPYRAAATDACYGITLARYSIENISCAGLPLHLLEKLPIGLGLVEIHLFRGARAVATRNDLVCSAFNEQDFGGPKRGYIHYRDSLPLSRRAQVVE